MDKVLNSVALIILAIVAIISVSGLSILFMNSSINGYVVLNVPVYSFEEVAPDLPQQTLEQIQQPPIPELKEEPVVSKLEIPSQQAQPEPQATPQQQEQQIQLPVLPSPAPEQQVIQPPSTSVIKQSQETVEQPVPAQQIETPKVQEQQPIQKVERSEIKKSEKKVEVFDLGNNEFLVMIFDQDALSRGEQSIMSNGYTAVRTTYQGKEGYGFKVKNS